MDLSGCDDRFLASIVLGWPDYDAQLYAIRDVLRWHGRAADELSNEIKAIGAFVEQAPGSASERAVDDLVDHLHQSVFRDAAYSMAAVGMLAPFIEFVFKRVFAGIRDRLDHIEDARKGHVRWVMQPDKQWDCSYALPCRKHLVDGIVELADAIGLAADLPAELRKTLAALFGYRNKMFHLGFEWPESQLAAFERRIESDGWPGDWFDRATSAGKPWVFYLSDTFVDHCLATVEQIFSGLGAFVRRNDRSLWDRPTVRS